MLAMLKLKYNPHLSLILATVVLLRAFIPVGFMPELSALHDGKINFIVCTGFGTKTIQVDLDSVNQHDHPSTSQHTNTVCPFFGLTSVVLPILLMGALTYLLATTQRFFYQPLFLWFTYFNQAAPPRAPPHIYFVV
jgi:hypothetical protein